MATAKEGCPALSDSDGHVATRHARLIAVGEAAAFGKSRIRWLSACICLFCNSYARGAKSYGRGT